MTSTKSTCAPHNFGALAEATKEIALTHTMSFLAISNAEHAAEPAEDTSKYIEIKSPMIGTFYRRPSPDKPNFVEVGTEVKKGDVICIIEAMKLFNEIEAEVTGKVVKTLVDDSTPVEYDQPLFVIDPS
mgnify:CR=1 FL=1